MCTLSLIRQFVNLYNDVMHIRINVTVIIEFEALK